MKKTIYILGMAAAFMGGISSCTLDAEDYVSKSGQNFPATDVDAAQALAGIYQNLNQVSATPECSFLYAAMLASDDCLGGGGPNDLHMQSLDMLLNSKPDMTQQFWKDRYQGINRANSLLDGVGNIELSEAEKNQIEGEAKFLRAFYYYELASMYGRVPLTISSQSAEAVQPTAAELWGQILQDLRDAADIMPAERRTDGHVDKFTAEAMLGRAWLFYTGMYGNGEDLAALTSTSYSPLTSVALPDGSTLTKDQVISYIDDCVNNSGYSLVTSDFRNLWAYTNRFTVEDYSYTQGQNLKWVEDDNGTNPETLFAIKYNKLADWGTSIGYANNFALHFGVRGMAGVAESFPFGQGWGAGPAAPNLVNDWKSAEPSDKRIKASVSECADWAEQGWVLGGGGEFIQETGYLSKKWLPVSAKNGENYSVCFENLMYGTDGWAQGSDNLQLNNIHDLVLIRFADVLLMQSELKENTDGINRVRARAGLSPISAYSLQALQNERRWELAFESIRWNDIRRWHIAAAALEKQVNVKVYTNGVEDTNKAHNGGYAARYNATAGFFKIPESEVDMSNGGITQNPGWEGADSQYNRW
ncbi:RagB/SusD family nutrient uptake outer membrane protein [Parabacteroides sp.]